MLQKPKSSPINESKYQFRKDWYSVLEAAAREVFQMMAGADLVGVAHADPPKPSEVVAMVGLAGELCGLLTVQCSKDSAITIACHMLGIPESDASVHAGDALGEICNMVAGNFKSKIDGLEDKCMLSVPTVIIGSNYAVHSIISGHRIELLLLFHHRELWFRLEIRA